MNNLTALNQDDRMVYEKLNNQLASVVGIIDSLTNESKIIDISSDESDNASELERQSADLHKLTAHRVRKKELERALQKVISGDYGICNDCYDEIGEGRLEAKPDAVTCITCQSIRERKDGQYMR